MSEQIIQQFREFAQAHLMMRKAVRQLAVDGGLIDRLIAAGPAAAPSLLRACTDEELILVSIVLATREVVEAETQTPGGVE